MEVSTTFIELPSLDATALSFDLKLTQGDESEMVSSSNKWLIIALDNSGSMAGSGIQQATDSIVVLAQKLLDIAPELKITIISYNTSAKVEYNSDKADINKITNTVRSIRANGGTLFVNAFKEISTIIHKNFTDNGGVKEDISIVFFTDGCDNSATGRAQEIQKLKDILEREASGAALHTIGFTSSHDARLLGEITSIGTTQGTFQYVPNAQVISDAIVSLIQVLSVKGVTVVSKLSVYPISCPIEPFDKKVFFVENTPDFFTTISFLPPLLLDGSSEVVLTVSIGSTTKEFNIDVLVEKKAPSFPQIVEAMSAYVTDTLMQLSQELFGQAKPPTKELQNGQSIVKNCDRQIQRLSEKVNALEDETVKQNLLSLLADNTSHTTEFHKVLTSAVENKITNEAIAKLNALAYKKVTKRSLAKKL